MIGSMSVGKALRLRRIFGRGRALVVDTPALEPDPVSYVRRLAHTGVDAVILTPGLLETVADELGELAVVLSSPEVEEVLQAGADAVITGYGELRAMTPEARRCGVPVFVEMPATATPDSLWEAVHLGADVICVDPRVTANALQVTRAARRTVLVDVGSGRNLIEDTYELMQGPAHGILLGESDLIETATLEALHALVHQGVSASEANAMLQRSRPAVHGNRI